MKKRITSFFAVLMTVVSVVVALSTPVSAASSVATVGKTYSVLSIDTRSSTAKVTYNKLTYKIKNGKTIKLDAFKSKSCAISAYSGIYKSNGTKINIDSIFKQIRFDIHVYDNNGRVVNYKIGACDGGEFKVMSKVNGIKQSEYTVTITAYISSYKTLTLKAGDNGKLALCYSYNVKYK